eukprot:gene24748-17827_t
MYAYDKASYQHYLYAACIVQAAPFAAKNEAAFATAAATVHMGTLKSKIERPYLAEGKPDNPVVKHAKDVLRCLGSCTYPHEKSTSSDSIH